MLSCDFWNKQPLAWSSAGGQQGAARGSAGTGGRHDPSPCSVTQHVTAASFPHVLKSVSSVINEDKSSLSFVDFQEMYFIGLFRETALDKKNSSAFILQFINFSLYCIDSCFPWSLFCVLLLF